MKKQLIEASKIIETIVKKTNRNYQDYVRYISLANQGVNPFSLEEIKLATDEKTWAKLLKSLKK
jgi:hypothetical protein